LYFGSKQKQLLGQADILDTQSIRVIAPTPDSIEAESEKYDLVVNIKGFGKGDIYWTRNGTSDILVTERVVDVLVLNKIEGFVPRPVELHQPTRVGCLFEIRPTHFAHLNPVKPFVTTESDGVGEAGFRIASAESQLQDFTVISEFPAFSTVSEKLAKLIISNCWAPSCLAKLDEVPLDVESTYKESRMHDVARLVLGGVKETQALEQVLAFFGIDMKWFDEYEALWKIHKHDCDIRIP